MQLDITEKQADVIFALVIEKARSIKESRDELGRMFVIPELNELRELVLNIKSDVTEA